MTNRAAFHASILATILLAASPASADQAEWVDRATAEAELRILREAGAVRFYCSLCDDTESEWVAIRSVSSAAAPEGQREVRINDEPIDAAYTYVRFEGEWTNLAMLVDYDVRGVPRVLAGSLAPPDPVEAPQGAPSAGSPPTDAIALDARCTIDGDERNMTRSCANGSASPDLTVGDCGEVARGELATTEGLERVLDCTFADGAGATVVVSGTTLRIALSRWELAGQRTVLADVVPNGPGVLEAIVTTSDEDGSAIAILASRADAFESVFRIGLGGGMADPDFFRTIVYPATPGEPLVARVTAGRRRYVERWRWDAASFRFVEARGTRRR